MTCGHCSGRLVRTASSVGGVSDRRGFGGSCRSSATWSRVGQCHRFERLRGDSDAD